MGSHSSHALAHDDGKVHAHVAKAHFYWGIFGALVILTVITVLASYVDFGSGNTVIAILIATTKASLVAAFFMHLRHDKPFNTYALLIAFLFLGLFLLLTYDDLAKRAEVDQAYGGTVNGATGEIAPGGMPNKNVIAPEAAEHGGEHGAEGAKPAEPAPHH